MNMDGWREATTFGRGPEKRMETHWFFKESEWPRTRLHDGGFGVLRLGNHGSSLLINDLGDSLIQC